MYVYPPIISGLEISIEVNEEELVAKTGVEPEANTQAIMRRDRKRAGLLNLINGTRNWQYDRYLFNMDSTLQDVLGLSDDALSVVMPHYAEVKGKTNKEYIELIPDRPEDAEDYNQKLYRHIYDALSALPFNNFTQPEELIKLIQAICEKAVADCNNQNEEIVVRNSFGEIEKMVQDLSDKTPEEIVEAIPAPIDVLRALLFVVKNPNRYDLFLESLNVYHADCLTKRRAVVLWGAMNGLYGMPGAGFNKDNRLLWQLIEAKAAKNEDGMLPSLSVSAPEVKEDNKSVLGIPLMEKRIITATDVRNAVLKTPKEQLNSQVFNMLLEAAIEDTGSKKKAENRGYMHSLASVSLPEIKAGDELTKDIRKLLEKLVSDCKKSIPNKEKLYADYVINEEKFSFVFRLDEDFWKKEFSSS